MSATVEEIYYYVGNCSICSWITDELESRDEAQEHVRDHNGEYHTT